MKMWLDWEGSSQGFSFKAKTSTRRRQGRISGGDALGGDREEI